MKKLYIIIWILMLLLLFILVLSSCTRTVTLYFTSMEGSEFYLVPETRQIDSSVNMFEQAVRELVKGPYDKGIYPTLPHDVTVNSVKIMNRLAIVDFDISIISNFEDIPHSSTMETLALYSITNTLTEFEEVDRVKITIEGKESGQVDGFFVEDFWGHVGIYEEFVRNEEIIKDE